MKIDWANVINIINIISALVSLYAAIRALKFKNETKTLTIQISNKKELNELIILLTLSNEKIFNLPKRSKRGSELYNELTEIRSQIQKISQLAIANNAELFQPILSKQVAKWNDELSKYKRHYDHGESEEVIQDVLNDMVSEISSIISESKKHLL